jgi:hypothetical protein
MKNLLIILLLINSINVFSQNSETIPTIDCADTQQTIKLHFGSWRKTVTLPISGKFVEESHYVTTEDKFSDKNYPSFDDENIRIHLNRSLEIYKNFDSGATFDKLYSMSYEKKWTPQEGGEFGQGSVGDIQLKELTPEMELWMMNMMWASGQRPKRGTKYLISYDNRNVVVIVGYETGPQEEKFLGGLTGETHRWLGTDNTANIKLKLLKDQTVAPGPCNCK